MVTITVRVTVVTLSAGAVRCLLQTHQHIHLTEGREIHNVYTRLSAFTRVCVSFSPVDQHHCRSGCSVW